MHEIQLRGPWQARILSRAVACADGELTTHDPAADWQRVTLEDGAAWLAPDFRGVVRYQRRFGCPTGLLPNTRVELVIELAAAAAVTSEAANSEAVIWLNDVRLGAARAGIPTWRCEIREHLRMRNCLTIDCSLLQGELRAASLGQPHPQGDGAGWGVPAAVRLAIHDEA